MTASSLHIDIRVLLQEQLNEGLVTVSRRRLASNALNTSKEAQVCGV